MREDEHAELQRQVAAAKAQVRVYKDNSEYAERLRNWYLPKLSNAYQQLEDAEAELAEFEQRYRLV